MGKDRYWKLEHDLNLQVGQRAGLQRLRNCATEIPTGRSQNGIAMALAVWERHVRGQRVTGGPESGVAGAVAVWRPNRRGERVERALPCLCPPRAGASSPGLSFDPQKCRGTGPTRRLHISVMPAPAAAGDWRARVPAPSRCSREVMEATSSSER